MIPSENIIFLLRYYCVCRVLLAETFQLKQEQNAANRTGQSETVDETLKVLQDSINLTYAS